MEPGSTSESIAEAENRIQFCSLSKLAVNIVNLCQDRAHVIWQSTNHDLSN